MMNYDLSKFLNKGLLSAGVVIAYDCIVDKKEFGEYAFKDGLTFALSSIASEWAVDILAGVWNMNENSIQGMISRPLLTGIIYMYLYNNMIRPEFQGNTLNDNSTNFVMAALLEVLLSYVSNPLASLFGYKNY